MMYQIGLILPGFGMTEGPLKNSATVGDIAAV
jgi:hypothetical protein